MIGSAAREYKVALYLHDQAEGETPGSKKQLALLAEARKQEEAAKGHLLHAYSLAALEAKAFGNVIKPYDPDKAEENAKAAADNKLALMKRPKAEPKIIDAEAEPA
jgi:hypothetical protein